VEASVLKEATQRGDIRIVWFGEFAINISFIQSIYKSKSGSLELGLGNQMEITDEQREKNLEKLNELRGKIKGIVT